MTPLSGAAGLSAGQFRALVQRMAQALAALGVERGASATVSWLGGNLPETLAARYAANLAEC
ncbi:hypothetical protein ACFUIV_20260 [Streptomyces anulatus]|uniref:hypothetical protein n=1 Tax=Streptomyces anulatus TaxID=1892 RepID=UPI00363A59D8